jgi:hypothetical protein
MTTLYLFFSLSRRRRAPGRGKIGVMLIPAKTPLRPPISCVCAYCVCAYVRSAVCVCVCVCVCICMSDQLCVCVCVYECMCMRALYLCVCVHFAHKCTYINSQDTCLLTTYMHMYIYSFLHTLHKHLLKQISNNLNLSHWLD